MAKKCLIVKAAGPPKFQTRQVNRCHLCGRSRAYMRKVRALPDLLPGAGVGWSPPRRDEVELVAVRSDQGAMEYETVRGADG